MLHLFGGDIMKVTNSMIHKELKVIGYASKAVLKPTIKRFTLLNKLADKSIGKNIKGFYNDETWINSRDKARKIRVRIHKPLNCKKDLPGVLYLHGGGYGFTNPESEQKSIENLMNTSDCIIITPAYRLSLEAPYPAALNDCYDTLLWMKENSQELGIRDDQLIIYGGSAGGGLTAALCLYARDHKSVNIAFQVPLYPMIDDTLSTPSMKDNMGPSWSEDLNKFAWDLYLDGIDQDNIPIYAAPYRAKDLSSLPPAFSFVGSIDPFCDETINYMERLRDSGVKVDYKVFDQCYHAFEVFVPSASVSKKANAYIQDCFAYGIEHYFAKQD